MGVDARVIARRLEAKTSLPPGADSERVRGLAVPALPFRSGHLLAMRRFPATSVGPGYTSIWHRRPDGSLAIYQDQQPKYSCPRIFGPSVDEAYVVPIEISWPAPNRMVMDIDEDDVQVHWDMHLSSSLATGLVNTAAALIPDRLRRHPRMLSLAGGIAGPLLRAGRVRLEGLAPSGQDFRADMRRIWLIDKSTAMVNGEDLGTPGPLPDQQRLVDFWLPQRGFLALADGFFELYDPAQHKQVATRHELAA